LVDDHLSWQYLSFV